MDDKKDTTQKFSNTFYFLAGAGLAGAIGAFYYLYSLFNETFELNEEQEAQVEKISHEVNEISGGKLTTDTCVKIMSIANRVCEDIIKNKKPDIDERRREAYNNEQEYEKICYEYLEAKEYAYQSATQLVFNKFSVKMEDLQAVLQNCSPYEIEKKLHEHEQQEYDNSVLKDDKNKVKEAFLYFTNRFLLEMKKFYAMMSHINQSDQEYLMLRLMILKLRVDDDLYFNYKVNEMQIRYLIHKFNLYSDIDIKQAQEKLAKFDDMINLQA